MKFFTSKRSRRWLTAVLVSGLLSAWVMCLFWEDMRPHGAPSAADLPPGRQLVGDGNRVSQHEDAVAVTGGVGGEQNREAIDKAEQIANEHRELPDAARGDLLSFISAGKPKGLLDSEWQERVNVILNSLRDQQTGAASSHQGLTRLLVEMAAADADPILRMASVSWATSMTWNCWSWCGAKRSGVLSRPRQPSSS